MSGDTFRYDLVLRPHPGDHGLSEAILGVVDVEALDGLTPGPDGVVTLRADVALARAFKEVAAHLSMHADSILSRRVEGP